MKLILIPLFFIILIAISVQMINFQDLDYSTTSGNSNLGIDKEQINDLGVNNATFNLTLMGGFITLFTVIIAIGVLSGLNISVFGSTVQISERSQKLLYNSTFYGGIWGIFSVLATTGINGLGLFSIPVFGAFFYIILTLIYVLGINQQIDSS